MASKITRRKFRDGVKRTAVRRIANGSTFVAEARRLDCSPTLVRRWCTDDRYQSSGEVTPGALPTKARKSPARRAPKKDVAQPIVATYRCPHCSGALEVAA
jgi:transposase-like protein